MLNHRVVLHAIDATPARWRGSDGSSPLYRARTTASSPRNDLVKNCRVHPTHWLISTQVLVPLLLSAPEGAFSCSASQLPNLADAAEKLAIAPLTEGLVFQFWALEACRRAGLPYTPSVVGAGLAFGAWHGVSPNSLFLAALGAYWGHLYAQTRNVLVPVSMHAVWNAFTLGVGAFACKQ